MLSDDRAPASAGACLKLKTDKQRVYAIREGHPGTGMFPDTTMTTQELTDTLAYLAAIRRGGSLKSPSQ